MWLCSSDVLAAIGLANMMLKPALCVLVCCMTCPGAGGVSITLEDGSVETGDLLIGADGIWSKVRRQMKGNSSPCYSGYTCYTGERW